MTVVAPCRPVLAFAFLRALPPIVSGGPAWTGCLLLSLAMASCGGDAGAPPAPGVAAVQGSAPANGLALTPWHADFPFDLHLSPRVPGQWYGHTRRQALAKIVANLQGACTADAWQFAKLYFDNAPAESAELLADAADRNFLAPGLASFLENLAEAMARTGDRALAPALLRLLDHDNVAVRSRAMSSLISCGTNDAVLAAEKYLDKVNGRARADWFRAVARHVPDVVRIFKAQLALDNPGALTLTTILEESVKLPPALGVQVAEVVASERRVPPDMLLVAATILHQGGDRRGSSLLREFMRGENSSLQAGAVRGAAKADVPVLLDDIMRLVDCEDGDVRLAVAEVLAPLPGENIDDILTTMGADVAVPVRQLALRALAVRGKRYHLDQLVERVRTATGSNLGQAMQDVSASGDPAGLAAVYERLKKAPRDEHRQFMQALAYSRRIEVFAYLREIFLGEEYVLGASGLTSVSNAAMLMANLDGVAAKVIELFVELPRADYRRRAHLLRALGNVAGAGADQTSVTLVREFLAGLRSDRSEIPQMRLLALQFARRLLTLDDVMAIRAALPVVGVARRWALNAFLFEFF